MKAGLASLLQKNPTHAMDGIFSQVERWEAACVGETSMDTSPPTHTSPPSLFFYSLLPLSFLLPLPLSPSLPLFLPPSSLFLLSSPSSFSLLLLFLPLSLPPSLFFFSFLPPYLPLLPPSLPQVAGEDEGVREKAIEYVSSSLLSMRHHLFIPHPDNEKHLMALVGALATV